MVRYVSRWSRHGALPARGANCCALSLYWYGSGGEILSETNAAGSTLNEYIYFGGKRVALVPASGSALYYAEDTLGSSRVIVQTNGTLCYDADFTAFGGERAYINTCPQNYKFEGKERDTETQNDDFSAREYTWRFGRWLSSDWSSTPVAETGGRKPGDRRDVPNSNSQKPESTRKHGAPREDGLPLTLRTTNEKAITHLSEERLCQAWRVPF